jgi:hypothetical protein
MILQEDSPYSTFIAVHAINDHVWPNVLVVLSQHISQHTFLPRIANPIQSRTSLSKFPLFVDITNRPTNTKWLTANT